MTSSDEPGAPAPALRELLSRLLAALPPEFDPAALSPRRRKQLLALSQEIARALEGFSGTLDPIRQPTVVFNPAHPETVGVLIAETLLKQPRVPLAEVRQAVHRFYGSEVYALYYRGDLAAYQPVGGKDTPLYVGKADPASHNARTPQEQGDRLWGRLSNDHARSIRAAENLNLDEFDCRFLVVISAWQNTAETYLIQRYRPVWNDEVGICYGFGKHGDAPETRRNTRSPWDTLHPGRGWATREGNVPYPLSPQEIVEQISRHYEGNPPTE